VNQRIILTVTNDLTGDQRIHKVAMSLLKSGYTPVLAGRRLRGSQPLSRPYPCVRFRLPVRKGPLFYALFNIRLFCFLSFCRADRFLANDLDTLPAVFLAGRLRGKPVIYDSHEYFTEVPELVGRPGTKRIWEAIESRIFPKLKRIYTVNESIAAIYREKYGVEIGVIRNLPPEHRSEPLKGFLPDSFSGHPLILYQGAVNIGRGLEQMIRAMNFLPDLRLVIVGDGDIKRDLSNLVRELTFEDRVWFAGRIPFENLAWYTGQATLGISLEQDIGLNYRYALPNKLFDYMQAGLPVLASDLPEIRRVVMEADFGMLINRFNPEYLADVIGGMIQDRIRMEQWHQNALKACPHYTWESQESTLLSLVSGL